MQTHVQAPAPTTTEQARQQQHQPEYETDSAQLLRTPQFEDGRPEVTAQLHQQSLMANSPRATQLKAMQAMMANSPRVAQLQATQAMMAASPRVQQLKTTQAFMAAGTLAKHNQQASVAPITQRMEDEEPLQSMAEEPVQREQTEASATDSTPPDAPPPETPKPNNTGLPDQLKTGIENLSGISIDHVKVHYNSDKPAQLQAHAYAQGSEIHVAPGQEKHLPHEAWHVVQQAQGRVKPTVQMKGGVDVNDDEGLEREADVMGADATASHVAIHPAQRIQDLSPVIAAGGTAQLGRGPKRKKSRRKSTDSSTYGSCSFSAEKPPRVQAAAFFGRPPSSSRSGQGDHVVAYALIKEAVNTSVKGKALDEAGQSLAALVTESKNFVGLGNANKNWHSQADNVIVTLNAIGTNDKAAVRIGINNVLLLLNIMPGTAIKRKKSTGGHGEAGSKGGVQYAEQQVTKGNNISSNIWVNVLNLFDGAADSALLNDQTKLESKLGWLMTLFSAAAPTIVALLKKPDHALIPDTDLQKAVDGKFDFPASVGVVAFIKSWLN